MPFKECIESLCHLSKINVYNIFCYYLWKINFLLNEFPLLLTVLVHCLLMESLNRKSTRWEQETRWTTNETFQTFGKHWWKLWRIQETHEIEVKTPRGVGWGQEEAWLVKFVAFCCVGYILYQSEGGWILSL